MTYFEIDFGGVVSRKSTIIRGTPHMANLIKVNKLRRTFDSERVK